MTAETFETLDLLAGCAGRTLTGVAWLNEPKDWTVADGVLRIVPNGHTDMFRKIAAPPRDDACFLFTTASGDFSLTACVKADGVEFGDAGGIAVRVDHEHWAKLCIERSPLGETSIVSVVTNEWSDDANNELLHTADAWLRITRLGNLIGMHYRMGQAWRFVRAFGVNWAATVRAGLIAQAPLAAGCTVRCSTVTLSSTAVRDFRSGE